MLKSNEKGWSSRTAMGSRDTPKNSKCDIEHLNFNDKENDIRSACINRIEKNDIEDNVTKNNRIAKHKGIAASSSLFPSTCVRRDVLSTVTNRRHRKKSAPSLKSYNAHTSIRQDVSFFLQEHNDTLETAEIAAESAQVDSITRAARSTLPQQQQLLERKYPKETSDVNIIANNCTGNSSVTEAAIVTSALSQQHLETKTSAISTKSYNTKVRHNADNPSKVLKRKVIDARDTIISNINYPTFICAPSKSDLEQFYQLSMMKNVAKEVLEQNSNKEWTKNHKGELSQRPTKHMPSSSQQRHLSQRSALLSFEEVFLPALLHQEDRALRQIQSQVQRTYKKFMKNLPSSEKQQNEIIQEYHPKHIIHQCRQLCFKTITMAITEASKTRMEREKMNEQRIKQWKEQKLLALEKERLEKLRLEEEAKKEMKVRRQKRKREMERNYPHNKKLWREIAYLMTEISKLKKEEKLWKDAEQSLALRHNKILQSVEEKIKANKGKEKMTADQIQKNGFACSETQTSQTQLEKEVLLNRDVLDETLQDIIVSTNRIIQAAATVSSSIHATDNIRKQLYQKYRQDHQFQGYLGVKDPKALIRALSQSQDPIES